MSVRVFYVRRKVNNTIYDKTETMLGIGGEMDGEKLSESQRKGEFR